MKGRKGKWEAVKVPAQRLTTTGYEVKLRKGAKTWYTVADTYCVPGIGNAQETAERIAKALNLLDTVEKALNV